MVPITTGIAWEIAEIESRLHRDESTNRDRINSLAGDAIVAGAAVELDATVVTNDVEAFRALGVPTETWG
ncbi:type II toxin-antitoxin system VapC family toxin [Salinigranum salinum]|uniref:type II toxin-antitoxin system VapC family toxin n=1 Tax=Salinigranum salinum TaxID=1364937 RepID=UPI0037429BD6